jgi:hypothetical protein
MQLDNVIVKRLDDIAGFSTVELSLLGDEPQRGGTASSKTVVLFLLLFGWRSG